MPTRKFQLLCAVASMIPIAHSVAAFQSPLTTCSSHCNSFISFKKSIYTSSADTYSERAFHLQATSLFPEDIVKSPYDRFTSRYDKFSNKFYALPFSNKLSPIGLRISMDENSRMDDDDAILNYLNKAARDKHLLDRIPPKTKHVLILLTKLYLTLREARQQQPEQHAGEFQRIRKEFMDMLEEEYKPQDGRGYLFEIDNVKFEQEQKIDSRDTKTDVATETLIEKENKWKETIGRTLSFAAMYRLPSEVTSVLLQSLLWTSTETTFDVNASESTGGVPFSAQSEKQEDTSFIINTFRSQGWKAVKFPHGLLIRLKPKFNANRSPRIQRVSSKIFIPKRVQQRKLKIEAALALHQASRAKQLESRKAVLASLESELSIRSQLAMEWSKRRPRRGKGNNVLDVLKDSDFFPLQQNFWAKKWLKKWAKFVERQTRALKAAGRAGLISYGFLNFIWYTLSLFIFWHRFDAVVSATAAASASSNGVVVLELLPGKLVSPAVLDYTQALRGSLEKFAKVLFSVYIGSQMTKVLRLSLAVILAPLGGRALGFIERKFGLGKDAAFCTLTAVLLASCLGIWSTVVLGDAFLSTVGTF